MTTLADDKTRGHALTDVYTDPPMIAADIIFLGAAAGADGSGNARPLVAADPFLGFANEHADNSAGLAAARRVHLRSRGLIWLAVTNINSVDDCPCPVYASDDDTFTTVGAGNSYIGRAVFYNTNDSLALVEYVACKPLAAITDAPTNASEAHALNAVFDDTESEAALNALGVKINLAGTAINAILVALEKAGIIKAA